MGVFKFQFKFFIMAADMHIFIKNFQVKLGVIIGSVFFRKHIFANLMFNFASKLF